MLLKEIMAETVDLILQLLKELCIVVSSLADHHPLASLLGVLKGVFGVASGEATNILRELLKQVT